MTKFLTDRRSLAAAAVVLVLVAGWHYWSMYSAARNARVEVDRLESLLADAETAILSTDPAEIRGPSQRLHSEANSLRTHMKWDPFVNVGRFLPIIGGQVRATEDIASIASSTARIGLETAAIAENAERLRLEAADERSLTELLITFLDDSSQSVDRIGAEARRIQALRLSIGDRALVPALRSAVDRLDGRLPELVDSAERLVLARDLLPGVLGFEGERRYLLIALNEGELFPGGGFVTAAGVLTLNGGSPSPTEFVDATLWLEAWQEMGGGFIEPPGPLGRYLLRGYSWNLSTSNWSPDFPTWSQQALQFYELINGDQDVDGVIAVDLAVLERLLVLTGAQELEVEGTGLVRFTPENVILELEALTRRPFEPTDDRKSVIGDLADIVLRELLALPSDQWPDAVRAVTDLGAERHFQVLSFDADEQTLLRDVGFDGALLEAPGDYLQLNEASLNSTKLNLIIRPEGTYSIDIDALGDAHHRVSLTYANTLPEWAEDKDPQLVEFLMIRGLYGAYLRAFTPSSAVSASATLGRDALAIEDVGGEQDKSWFGVFFPVRSGESAEVVLEWTVPLAAADPDRYELLIQKQPGTPGYCLALDVTRDGKPAKTTQVTGGEIDETGRVCLTTDVRVVVAF